MATQIVGTLNNAYEYKLLSAGITEPLSTYLSDPLDTDRAAAGFVAMFSAASAGALETAYPAATYPGSFGKVAAALYWSNGTAWVAVTTA